jgi:gluconolactonase
VYRLRGGADGKAGELQRLLDNAPSPNGITMNAKNTQVYVAITRSQQIWRLPLMAGGSLSKTGVAIQLSGGHAGPDGIEMDEEDGLAVCHLGVGIWRFDSNCLPTHLVHAGKAHRLMTNIAYGGRDRRTLYITDSLNGEILTAKMPVAGKKLFAHH